MNVNERLSEETHPLIELKHISKIYNMGGEEVRANDDVNISIQKGEFVAIVGKSGSGKSMSIKAAMGLLDKNFVVSGSAKFQGDELVGKNAEQLRRLRGGQVGIVLQNPMTCFDPLYRIGNQIAETFAAHQKWDDGEIKERSIEMLDKMQIRNPEEALEKYPHQLSGGMLQRIMIGIAMSMEPSLLIADEPTTAIDAITQFDILNEFAAIKQKHKTAMIFISHDLNAVSQIADKIVVLNQGTVVDQGDFHHIIHHAADPYTRLLIEKRTDVMRKYRQALEGGECSHAQAG